MGIHRINGSAEIQAVCLLPFQEAGIGTGQICTGYIPVPQRAVVFQLHVIPYFRLVIHIHIQNVDGLSAQDGNFNIAFQGRLPANRILVAQVDQRHNIPLCRNLRQALSRFLQPLRGFFIHISGAALPWVFRNSGRLSACPCAVSGRHGLVTEFRARRRFLRPRHSLAVFSPFFLPAVLLYSVRALRRCQHCGPFYIDAQQSG